LLAASLTAQQVPDTSFLPALDSPTFASGRRPVVAVDAAHHNFHTADHGFLPFAELLRRDGYTVFDLHSPLSDSVLHTIDILVVANALHPSNVGNWRLPTPSAFTEHEIASVSRWVQDGGSLFLIADHMPFPGAAKKLAASVGVTFHDGFAIDTTNRGFAVFRQTDGTLTESPLTIGIDSVVTFTGQAFWTSEDYTPLVVFGDGFVTYMPEIAWDFNDSTECFPVKGWTQVAAGRIGNGRVVVSGEAAMFTAQLVGDEALPVGMNYPGAPDNLPFLLNLMHFLAGRDDVMP
jgi:hypothetical protein